MKTNLSYQGYLGSMEADLEEGFLFGRLLFINDVVSYRGDSVPTLQQAFRDAVDDYLKTCAELKEVPDTPCKGSFNVRVGSELHQAAALAAMREGIKLNEWVKQACQLKLASTTAPSLVIEDRRNFEETGLTFEAGLNFHAGGNEEWQQQTSNLLTH